MPLALPEHPAATCCDLLCSEDATELAEHELCEGAASAAAAWPPAEFPDDSGESVAGFIKGDASTAAAWPLAEFPDDSDESVAGFIEGAADYSPGSDYPDRFRSNSLDLAARKEAVAWILKVHAYYRFHPPTAYLAVNYMDRFLSSHRLPQNEWALQLLSVACVSLAAKMDETFLPSLLDLQVEGAKFIFEPRAILRMELLVLTALNWRLRSVTPFTFIDFFVHKIDPTGKYAQYLVALATEITLATLKDIRFLSHCPSSLAAAAIIHATDEIMGLDFTNPETAASWCIGLTEEGITNCYHSLENVIINRSRRPSTILSRLRVATSIDLGPRISSSSSPNKRRKLKNNCLWVDSVKESS